MKRKLIVLLIYLLLVTGLAHAANYYFSSSTGDDSRTPAQAQNPATPWRTIAKLNSFFSSLSPGDNILFMKGDVFTGSIVVTKSGSSGSPITFGAYGSGVDPVITGSQILSAWTNLGGGIYEASLASQPKVVTISGKQYAPGRFPDNGWLKIDMTTGIAITSSGLAGQPNYTGGKVVTRKTRWIIDKDPILLHTGNTISFTVQSYTAQQDYGFFITEHLSTLTKYGEWVYEGGKLKVYFGGAGTSDVSVSMLTQLVTITNQSNISFTGLDFNYTNGDMVWLHNTSKVSFDYCDFSYSGNRMLLGNGNGNTNLSITNCSIHHINNIGIQVYGGNNAFLFKNNLVSNIGTIPGEGGNGDGTYNAMSIEGNGTTNAEVSYNRFDTIGYVVIGGGGENYLCKNNVLDYFCFIKDDGGGIYIQEGTSANKRITGNIIMNGVGATEGTPYPERGGQAKGIYSDGGNTNTEIDNNSVTNCDHGIYMDNSQNINIHDNTVYGCRINEIAIDEWYYSMSITGLQVLNNKAVSNSTSQHVFRIENHCNCNTPIAGYGTINYNYWARPLNDNNNIWSWHGTGGAYAYTLAQWQALYGYDLNSHTSPISLSDPSKIRFEYNDTNSDKIVSLPGTYITVDGVSYSGSATLAPFTSLILLQTSAAPNQPPVANAGTDKTITLPVNTVTQTGSGSDPNGTISTYLWTKIAGPIQYTIVSPAQAQTVINNLQQGVYQFELKVTDNQGATGRDTVLITVNPAPNQPPIANAGTDKTISLPVNSVTQSGSGSDADGTVSSYLWTKISGPIQYTIVSPTQAQTLINNLQQGVYQFELKVTDNQNATGKDTVVITVNAAPPPNQAPLANAGTDKTITLPVNSVTQSGSGSDTDGTVSSYLWTKISGPVQYTIVSPTQAQTLINNLQQGVYQFELKVTDNQNATGKDTVVITVNAAPPPPNQAPVANAGTDKIITLPVNSVTQSGSGSDADGTVSSYLWTKIAGPIQYTIVSPTQAQTLINNLQQGVYQFELKVTDNQNATGKDTVVITVNAAPPPPNQPPVANAGTDKTITLPVNSVTQSGSGSDADGTVSAYLWTKIAGPTQYTIVSPTQAQTVINNLQQGVYQFELTVTDNQNATGKDTVVITVNAAPPPPNQPPVANAGTDKTITLPINSVTQSGSGSDADGTVSAYLWTKIAGPTQYSIVSPTQAQTVINNLQQGVYQFELKVTDNQNATGKDTVVITVNPAPPPPNQPPVANAGTDKTITLPVNSVTQSGSGSDADGTISAYLWTKIAGPTQYTIVSPAQAQAVINNLQQGVYQFELSVTDNQNATGKDTVVITVNPAPPPPPNQPPVANAGTDKTITLPVNSVTQSGNGSDADGAISSYLWTKIAGPAQYNIVSPTQAQTLINNLQQGVYQFELTVADNQNATGKDTVVITVNPAPNQAPLANAGPDKIITLLVNTITQTGSGSDADGTIISYLWTKVSGPARYTIVSPNQAETVINGLDQGVYQFELTVTDNLGATGKDTMVLRVNSLPPQPNQPPSANAGPDQTITLPTNSVTASGFGIDFDGTVASYLWTNISGPLYSVITNPNQAQTQINNLNVGIYCFELTVADNQGAIGRDTMFVTVNAPIATPPVVFAGLDQTITLPENSVTLKGSWLIDPDLTITAHLWTMISGPAPCNISLPDSFQTMVTRLMAGVYLFEYSITTNQGTIGKDTMRVEVKNYSSDLEGTLSVYPNPSTEYTNLRVFPQTIGNPIHIKVYDSRGIIVFQEQITGNQQIINRRIDMNKYPKGVYFMIAEFDFNSRKTVIFIKQ